MKVEISLKGFTTPKKVKEQIKEKIEKLNHRFISINHANLILKKENNNFISELEVKQRTLSAFASEKSSDIMSCVNAVVANIERQLQKKLEKIRDRKRTHVQKEINPYSYSSDESHVIFRSIVPEVYTEQDALIMMEKHNEIIVFRNQDTNRLNILHRRADGNLELIEVE